MKRFGAACAVVTLLLTCGLASAQTEMKFKDASAEAGLVEPLKGMMGHSAAVGDVDGDGQVDLFVGCFTDRPVAEYVGRSGPIMHMLLIQKDGKLSLSKEPDFSFAGRGSGACFVDLDNDGDLDLYVSLNTKPKNADPDHHNRLYENLGGGKLEDISGECGACPVMGGRTVGVLDYDGDGLLDLLVLEDYWTGKHPRLFKNLGKLKFKDVTAEAGLGEEIPGLGVVTCDLNGDGWPDVFISEANRLFVNDRNGHFMAVDSTVFASDLNRRGGKFPCGAAFGDLNNDGRFDLITSDHCEGARIHLFLNTGVNDGKPQFKEVSGEVGLGFALPAKAEGRKDFLRFDLAEVQDFDNDGLPDIMGGAIWKDGETLQPFICRNTGMKNGLPQFVSPPVAKVVGHTSAAPTGDFNRDGRIDTFFCSWYPTIPSQYFLNEGPVRNWLSVRVVGKTVNRMGVGCNVAIYKAGQAEQPSGRLGMNEIHLSQGYCSGREAEVHFGLGDEKIVDVVVTLPFGKGKIVRKGVAANQLLVVQEGE